MEGIQRKQVEGHRFKPSFPPGWWREMLPGGQVELPHPLPQVISMLLPALPLAAHPLPALPLPAIHLPALLLPDLLLPAPPCPSLPYPSLRLTPPTQPSGCRADTQIVCPASGHRICQVQRWGSHPCLPAPGVTGWRTVLASPPSWWPGTRQKAASLQVVSSPALLLPRLPPLQPAM